MIDDIKLTKIEESLLVSNTILSKTDALVRAIIKFKDEEKDFVFISLLEALILEICKYIDEYEKYLMPAIKEKKLDWITTIHEPFFNELKSSNIRKMRNRHIAHGHRTYNGQFIYLMDTVEESEILIDSLDICYLGRCTTSLIFLTAHRLQNDLGSALDKYKLTLENHTDFFKSQPHFDNVDEINSKIKELGTQCESKFYEIYPDEDTWNKYIETSDYLKTKNSV